MRHKIFPLKDEDVTAFVASPAHIHALPILSFQYFSKAQFILDLMNFLPLFHMPFIFPSLLFLQLFYFLFNKYLLKVCNLLDAKLSTGDNVMKMIDEVLALVIKFW